MTLPQSPWEPVNLASPAMLPISCAHIDYPDEILGYWKHLEPASDEVLAKSGIDSNWLQKTGLICSARCAFNGRGLFHFDDDGDVSLVFSCSRRNTPYADLLAFNVTNAEEFGFLFGTEPLLGDPFYWQLLTGVVCFFPNPLIWLRARGQGCLVVIPDRAGLLLRSIDRIGCPEGCEKFCHQLNDLRKRPPGFREAEFYEVTND